MKLYKYIHLSTLSKRSYSKIELGVEIYLEIYKKKGVKLLFILLVPSSQVSYMLH